MMNVDMEALKKLIRMGRLSCITLLILTEKCDTLLLKSLDLLKNISPCGK